MKQRQRERKIKKAFAKIERNNKQIAKLEKSYQQLVEAFEVEHFRVKMIVIKLEYLRNLLNAKNQQEKHIIKLLNA